MLKPEDCKPGVAVLYQPIVKPDRPKYRATVRDLPWQLGDGTWVTHLSNLEPAYAEATGGRTVVHAAMLGALELAPAAAPPCTPEDRAVVTHLVRLIQENPDVRYYVGGSGSQMRVLLLAAITAAGFEGDPVEALKPAPHRRDDLTQVEQLRRQIDDLRAVNGGYRG